MAKRMLDVASVYADAQHLHNIERSEKAATESASISESSFKRTWEGKIRPALLLAVTLLRIINKKASGYVAQAVAFIDLTLASQEAEEE